MNERGKPLDKVAFEKSLVIKRGKNHSSVYEMVKAVSDYDQPFSDTFDKHFDREAQSLSDETVTQVAASLLALVEPYKTKEPDIQIGPTPAKCLNCSRTG